MRKITFIFSLIIFLGIGLGAQAASLGEQATFNIEPSYDLSARSEITATLRRMSPSLYFYIDDSWWASLTFDRQIAVFDSLTPLAEEFENKIYPTLTQTFGEEWKPGIDKDTRITILIHPMKEGAGGYWNSTDEYLRTQYPTSNEREMIYLNARAIDSAMAKIYLAHEFQHLIAFNQKTKLRGVVEDVWLNEARSEYTATLLGYDVNYEGSNLQQRVRNFLDRPYDSLTEWQNKSSDYGVINLFIQYLVDRFGIGILSTSLMIQKAGIASIDEALKQIGHQEDFSQVFNDWLLASYLNDCNLSQNYCYLNQNLKNFRVTPLTNFIPILGQSTLSIVNTTKDWAGNWFKFVGGRGALKIEFTSRPEAKFKVPYVIVDSTGKISISFMDLNSTGKGVILIPDFGAKIASLVIMPSVQNKTSNFTNSDPAYQFSWTASTTETITLSPSPSPSPPPSSSPSPTPSLTIEQLLSQIAVLQKEITRLQAQLLALSASNQNQISCQKFEQDLYFGLTNNNEVRCLQEFLKSRGGEIYPVSLITGNFLNLTFEAVKKYQASRGIIQTGYFGPLTRAAANQDLTSNL